MSQLTKSAKAQKIAFMASFKSFNTAAIAVLSAEREQSLQTFFDAAAVPAIDASKQAQKDWARANILPLLPVCTIAAVGGVTFTTNKEKAYQFTEDVTADAFKNCGALSVEFGAATGQNGALRTAYFYHERAKRVPVVAKDLGAAGKVYKVDESGARVFELVTVREYIAKRGDVFTAAEVINAFFAAVGITQAIAAEALEAAKLKAAKAVAAAELAAAKAATTAADAAEKAKNAKKRASEKAAAAVQVQAAENMTAADAAAIISEDASKKAATQGEQAEQASRAKGEQVRKKANTRTKASEQITK